ncbi:MAG: ABC transporter ATP-binding protein [Acidimicrobiia bacterium]
MSIEVNGLTVSYDDEVAVSAGSFVLEDGEHFAVMGPSGAGKSSLLRAIAGLEPVASGTIAIDGTDVTSVAPHQRPIGLMFQDFALFPHLSVSDNVAFGLRMAGVGTDLRRTRASDLLKLVGLAGYENRHPQSLSGGEQQRVALARTLAPKPSLVLLDEPLGSLDQNLKEDLLHEMREIMSDVGATSIYVTHDRHEAEAYADRIAVMRDGWIKRIATPSELWTDPQTTFIARFIGHRNIVDGSAVGLQPGMIVIPARAISVVAVESSDLVGRVVATDFSDGEYWVTLRFDSASLVTVVATRPDLSTDVGIEIDKERVAALTVDEI